MKKKFTDKQIHILNVAEKLIAKKGFEGTSVRDISTSANINVAMISYYFGSKEKMMSYLYQYRVQKTRESFAEFAEIIRDGKPEMQMKELIKYVVNQLFKFNYFHGFVTQELRHTEHLKDDLLEFYNTFTAKIDGVIKKGVASGVFHNAPKPEDILTLIVGSSLFVIRNKNFYEIYVTGEEENYLEDAEKKVLANLLVTVFSLLGYQTTN
jgi:AcrR family transcriptional regulator